MNTEIRWSLEELIDRRGLDRSVLEDLVPLWPDLEEILIKTNPMIASLEEKLAAAESDYRDLESDYNDLESELKETKDSLWKAESEIIRLEEKLSVLE